MNSKFLLSAMSVILLFCFIALSSSAGMNMQKDCLINSGPCSREIENEGMNVVLDILPKPVSPMKELTFTVTLAEHGSPVEDASVAVDLTMPGMFMGINRPALIHTVKGTYKGKGVIQACPRGGKIWKAEVTITRQDRSASVSFTFEVE